MTERGAGEEMEEERQSGGAERQLPQRTRRYSRQERPPLPHEHPPSSSHDNRGHIDKVARYVAEDEDGQLVEKILLKLLRRYGEHARWGFLSADDPRHSYYVRKVAEWRRTLKAGDP